jgi:hypothetical protein
MIAGTEPLSQGDRGMQPITRCTRIAVLVSLALGLAGGPARAAPPEVVGKGEVRSLSAFPERLTLRGAERVQQLVVTARHENGGVSDATARATFRSADPAVARVEPSGLVVPLKNGTTEVTAELDGRRVTVAVVVEGTESEEPINFTNEIVPIFTKTGCNAGACHGKSTGQNGFRLSLLGFEPQLDYDALTREGRGRRIFPSAPRSSLVLLKSTGAVPHGGGKRVHTGSRDYELLVRWLRSGAPFGRDTDPKVTGISVTPGHRLVAPRARQQIAVTAHNSDGSARAEPRGVDVPGGSVVRVFRGASHAAERRSSVARGGHLRRARGREPLAAVDAPKGRHGQYQCVVRAQLSSAVRPQRADASKRRWTTC